MSRKDCNFQASDGEFHYIDWGGNGPVSHFSHATGLCAGVYTPLADKLKSRLKIFGMDDRGHGRTTATANPKKLKNWNIFVSDLEHFFESLNGPVIAMGHSRGATASLILAARRPDLVRALILIDPTILPYSWTWGWALAKAVGLSRCFAVCPHDVWRYIPRLQQPALIVYGADSDTFFASAAKRFKAEVPHVRLHCLEATSHFVPMERPDETVRAIISFLNDEKIV
jgi:pimeloyl-ACP methyl ester carboxylesterase